MASGSSGIAVYVNVFSDLVEDDGQFRECVAQFEDLCAAIWSTPDFVAWICSPAVNRDNRYTKMSQVLSSAGADETVRKTFLVMLRKGAVSLLPEFVRILREFADERLGILRARVETATGLADSIREKNTSGFGQCFRQGGGLGLRRQRGGDRWDENTHPFRCH